jgi:hypothetical protein
MKGSLHLLVGFMLFQSCVSFQKKELWVETTCELRPPSIGNFYGLTIADEGVSSEIWFTQNEKCLQVKSNVNVVYSGQKSLELIWDKQAGNCGWLGMGIGWDAWSGKNLSLILDKAAIQIKAFSLNGAIKSLPLAVALEDYSGQQAWLGMMPQYIQYLEGELWATITLPLNDFAWEQFQADAGNIKQLIIQFEASGNIFFDDIKLVSVPCHVQQQYVIASLPFTPSDVDQNQWITHSDHDLVFEDGSRLSLFTYNKQLIIRGLVVDDSPLQNGRDSGDIWNGDAIELAISTSTHAHPKRKTWLYSDRHFGIKMGTSPFVYDFKRNWKVPDAVILTKLTSEGYLFWVSIPFESSEMPVPVSLHPYQMEIAINKGDNTKRDHQLRWNSPHKEGFNLNPSLWGNVIFEEDL